MAQRALRAGHRSTQGGELHIVEVKTRRADGLTAPEDALTLQKQRALLHAALLHRPVALDGRSAVRFGSGGLLS